MVKITYGIKMGKNGSRKSKTIGVIKRLLQRYN